MMSTAHCRQCGVPRNPASTARCHYCGWLPPAASASSTASAVDRASAVDAVNADVVAANWGREPLPGEDDGIDAWRKFRELSAIDDAEKLMIEMLQGEERAAGFRNYAIEQFRSADLPARATTLRGLADHIDTLVLPLFADAIARSDATQSPKAAKVREHVVTRQRIWQMLAEALRRDDADILELHERYWHGVADLELVNDVMKKAQHASAPPEAQTAAFREALVAFTPRWFVTPTLMVVNIALLLASLTLSRQIIAPDSQLLLDWGANYGPATLNGQWWRLFTCMFLHGSFMHVLMNMWVLLDFGRLVERLTGNVGFLLVYVITGLAGSLASLYWNPQVLSVGASGAVFGIGGVLLGWTLRHRQSIPTAVLGHLRSSVAGFIFFNMMLMVRGGNIDHAAHAGGLVAGILCGLLVSQPLGPDVRKRRLGKCLLTGFVGCAALVGAANFLPPAPPAPINVQGEMGAFMATEKKAQTTFQAMLKAYDDGQLSNEAFANQVEQEILPAWTAARARLDKLRAEPLANQENIAKVARYAGERDTAWRTFVAAARDNDQEKWKQAVAQWQAADATVRAINGQ